MITQRSLCLLSLLSLITFSNALAADGKEIFTARCAMCHGDKGAGDGAAAAAFPADQKPASFAKGEFKFAKDEAKFIQLIKNGGGAVGLSALMPQQPDLSDADIKGLYAYVKTLKQ